MPTYDRMDPDKLRAELAKINRERDKLAAEAREITAILAPVEREEAARARLEHLSDDERAALRQMLSAEPAGRTDRVHEPGARER